MSESAKVREHQRVAVHPHQSSKVADIAAIRSFIKAQAPRPIDSRQRTRTSPLITASNIREVATPQILTRIKHTSKKKYPALSAKEIDQTRLEPV